MSKKTNDVVEVEIVEDKNDTRRVNFEITDQYFKD